MKHEVSVKSKPSKVWKNVSNRTLVVRYWACVCGRVGPEFHDRRVSDDAVLRGGRTHVTRANRARRPAR